MKIKMNATWNDYAKGETYEVEDAVGHAMSGGGYATILDYGPQKKASVAVMRDVVPKDAKKVNDAEQG